ncbi:hypothetical protein B6264_14850 [Kitasatospora aureofaciens]|nr:hypothetical protein B6264_14850 [Kitasatospora aureofaciens]
MPADSAGSPWQSSRPDYSPRPSPRPSPGRRSPTRRPCPPRASPPAVCTRTPATTPPPPAGWAWPTPS